MDALATSSLTKHYGHRELPIHRPGHRPAGVVRALEDLSIAVQEGEIFGFLGPNGAGKTTTIRLLLGYLHPTAGSATVLGRDIVRDSVDIRRGVG
jgi:ABC-2 type transport system ATP-binding protein